MQYLLQKEISSEGEKGMGGLMRQKKIYIATQCVASEQRDHTGAE